MVALGSIQQEALGKFKDRRGLTLKEIAKQTKWSPPYVTQVFGGDRRIPENFIEDLDQCFGLQPDEREELRLAVRSSERRVDLTQFSPMQRVVINTLIREIGDLDTTRQEKLMTIVQAFLKLDANELEQVMGTIPIDKLLAADWKYFDFATGHDARLGYFVKPMTFRELRSEARKFRNKVGVNESEPLPLEKIIEHDLGDIVEGATFTTASNFSNCKVKGFTDLGRRRIVVAEQIYRDWMAGDVNAEWVITHELAHLWLHSKENVFDLGGNGFANAEKQANIFSATTRATPSMYQKSGDYIDLASKGRVPLHWAKEVTYRYKKGGIRKKNIH